MSSTHHSNPGSPGSLSPMAKLQLSFLTWKRYLQRVLEPYGITLKQAFLLDRLVQSGSLLPSQAARLLFSDRPTVSVILRNMERSGWVRQERDTSDRRKSRILITPQGQAKWVEISQTPWRAPDSDHHPLACFNAAELQEFDRLMDRLYHHIRTISQTGEEFTHGS